MLAYIVIGGTLFHNIYMESNEDRVDAVLNSMEKNNDPQALSQGLTILCKLTANIISNPFQQKFRGIKTTNNTIKSKIMSLNGSAELLTTLGFVRENEEMYVLRDQNVYLFLQGQPAVDYKKRLVTSRLTSQADYKKQLELIKNHKQQRMEKQKRDQQTKRLKDQAKYDVMERKHMKVDTTKSNDLKFGSNTKTCKDMGIGQKGKGGGG